MIIPIKWLLAMIILYTSWHPKTMCLGQFLAKQTNKKYLSLRSHEILNYHRFLASLQKSHQVNRRVIKLQTTKSSLYFQYIIEHGAMYEYISFYEENGLTYFEILVLWWKDTCHRRGNSVLNLVVDSMTSLLHIKVIKMTIRFEHLKYNIPLTLPNSTYIYTIS